MSDQCKERVWQPHLWGYAQCCRRAVKDGYCKQHHPEAVAARKAEVMRRYEWQTAISPLTLLHKIGALEAALDRERRVSDALARMVAKDGCPPGTCPIVPCSLDDLQALVRCIRLRAEAEADKQRGQAPQGNKT